MRDFAVFGGVLRSSIEFPELSPIEGRDSTWSLELGNGGAPTLVDATSLGVDTVFGTCKVRAFRRSSGYTLQFDDTGRFDVSGDGRRLVWYCASDHYLAEGRADVIGRVLPVAMHAAGVLCLHASAVAVGREGIAFLAPKFHGKSTTATALLREGARLITDDVLPVRIAEPTMCLPGVPQLRLWRDSAKVAFDEEPPATVAHDAKLVVDSLRASQVQETPVPFCAAYLLTPVNALPENKAVMRVPLESIPAALNLVQQAKLAPLLAGAEAGALFSQAASVAASVRVYDLYVLRDLSRLGEVARTIVSWHSSDESTGS